MMEPLGEGDPREVDGYRLTGFLGFGDQGRVYAGYAPEGTPVAVKLLHTAGGPLPVPEQEPVAFEELASQVAAAARAGRSCQARVLDARLDVPEPYVVTRFVEGPNLFEMVCEDGALPEDELYRLAFATARELTALHAEGAVCGFIKPLDVIFGLNGPCLTGLGVTLTLKRAPFASRGVAAYSWMAPEVIQAEDPLPASDVYGWGACLLFAATGWHFFRGDVAQILHQILNARPDLAPLPPPLRPLIGAALAKTPSTRPPTETLLTRLQNLPGTPH